MAIITALQMREGNVRKWWMGEAWYDPTRATFVVLPIPFNRIARSIRWLWYWTIGGKGDRWTTQLLAAEQKGRDSVMEYALRIYDETDKARQEAREERQARDAFMAEYGSLIREVVNRVRWAEGIER